MSKFLRNVAALAMAGMIAASMVGCGGEDNKVSTTPNDAQTSQTSSEDVQKEKETVTLKVFNGNVGVLPNNILDNPVMNDITEKTGVIVDWSPYMGNGKSAEKASMLIASGDLPDIFVISNSGNINKKLLDNNLIIELDQLVETNGKDILENCAEAIRFTRLAWSNDTGKLFFVPVQVNGVNFYPSGYDMTFQYRWDLYKKMGKPKLETLDDLLNYMIEAQKLEPTNKDGKKNYGVGMPLGGGEWSYVDWNISHNYGFETKNNFVNFDLENDEVVARFSENSPFMIGAKFYNECFKAGVFDPESATMNGDQVREKGAAMRYFVGLANWQIGWPNDKLVAAKDPEKGFVPTLLDAKDDYVFTRNATTYGNGMQYSITKNCKNPEAAMDFINYTASWEGAEVMSNGPEGNGWQWVDGVPVIDPYDPNAERDPDGNKKVGISYVAPNMIVNGARENPKGWKTIYAQNDPNRFIEGMSAGEKDFCEEMGFMYGTELYDTREHNTFSTPLFNVIAPDPASDVAAIDKKVGTVINVYAVKLIYAKDDAEFDAAKEQMFKELNAVGYEEGVEWWKQQYSEMKEKFQSIN